MPTPETKNSEPTGARETLKDIAAALKVGVAGVRDLVDIVLTGDGNTVGSSFSMPQGPVDFAIMAAYFAADALNKPIHKQIPAGTYMGRALDTLGDWICTKQGVAAKQTWKKPGTSA